MHRSLYNSAGLATALLLSACGSGQEAKPFDTSTELPNKVQVALIREGHALTFPEGSSIPDKAETASLNAFLASSQASAGDAIQIERTPPTGKSSDALEARRTAALVAALSRDTLKPSVSYSPTLAPGEMSLTLERYEASAPDCPNWSKDPGNDFDNTLHSDFGCATAVNFAAMVADPRDLVVGRPLGPIFGDAAIRGIHAYRAGKPGETASGSNGSGSGAASSNNPGGGAGPFEPQSSGGGQSSSSSQ